MSGFLIPLMCFLSVSKVFLQSRYSKTSERGTANKLRFNGMMFAAAAVILLPLLISGGATVPTWICGTVMGVLSMIYQVCYITAFAKGSATLTVLINNFGTIIPIAVSVSVFGEPFGVSKAIGTVLAFVSLVLTVQRTADTSKKKGGYNWLLLALGTALCNGLISVNQKLYSGLTDAVQVFSFVGIAYVSAAVLCGCVCLFCRRENTKDESEKKTSLLFFSGLSGLILGVFQCVSTYAASVIDGSILYPVYNCAASLLFTVVGRVALKEILTFRQYLGIAVGTVAIVLMCL